MTARRSFLVAVALVVAIAGCADPSPLGAADTTEPTPTPTPDVPSPTAPPPWEQGDDPPPLTIGATGAEGYVFGTAFAEFAPYPNEQNCGRLTTGATYPYDAILLTFDGVRAVGASLLASAGIASIVAGLAAQSVLANVFASRPAELAGLIRMVQKVEEPFGTFLDRVDQILLVPGGELHGNTTRGTRHQRLLFPQSFGNDQTKSLSQ